MNDNHPSHSLCPTQHSMKRRASWHDYRQPGTYMLTLVVEGRRPLLGRLVHDGQKAWVEASALGKSISCKVIGKMREVFPQVEVWRICIMPDHIHMIVRVTAELPNGKHLGHVVAGFKRGCHRAAKDLELGEIIAENRTLASNAESRPMASNGGRPVPCDYFAGHSSLFEPGYNDRLLFDGEQLERWKHYLDDNPRRLWLKRQYPDLFTVRRSVAIAGRACQIIGNHFLLAIPDKVAVIYHRRYSEAEFLRLKAGWLACGERGGVLVSAAIHPNEKAVMREAMDCGYPVILLRENGFPECYKPSGEAFDACSRGQMLQVSPWDYHTEQKTISREQCLLLNALAEDLAR